MKFENKVSESPERKKQKQRLISELLSWKTEESRQNKNLWLVQLATILNHILERGMFLLPRGLYERLSECYIHIDLENKLITPSSMEEARSLIDEVLLELEK